MGCPHGQGLSLHPTMAGTPLGCSGTSRFPIGAVVMLTHAKTGPLLPRGWAAGTREPRRKPVTQMNNKTGGKLPSY